LFSQILGCTRNLCIKCCSDDDCLVHQEQRQKVGWKHQVMTGTTPLQQRAQWKRSQVIKINNSNHKKQKSFLKEPNFKYIGDTVVVWDIRQYLQQEQQQQQYKRDERWRKVNQRKKALLLQLDAGVVNNNTPSSPPVLRNNRKRFQVIYQRLLQKSLHENNKSNNNNDNNKS
jgi:hypothetical protein